MVHRIVIPIVLVLAARAAIAERAPEPSGPHPRILLDEPLRTAWKAAAKQRGSAVALAIARCQDTRANAKEYERDSYMGFDWAASLNSCLIAWAARGSDDDARSAITFVEALLDDREHIGDGKGGELSVRRDTGYPMRSLPSNVAIAYDWLHGHALMTPALRERIRERLTQWLAWYKKGGYHNRNPATNYNAGYVFSATLVSIALGGEGGKLNTELWNHVRDDIWGKDMARALAPAGLLDGGDFPEGWQYAPLSVAEYALAARIGIANGLRIDHLDRWLQAMLVRTIHARSGALDRVAVIGDTSEKSPSIAIQPLTLLAILIGPAPEAVKRQAAHERLRLKLHAKDFPLYEAVAEAAAIPPVAPEIDKWPTAYHAPGVNTFYARTTWARDGVWMSMICAPGHDVGHLPPMAGNVMITRGVDEVLIDPSPYGTLSTLTSNAPTVDSKQQLPNYRPSQGGWGESTHFEWVVQTATGVIASRCDYADQYKFQHRPTDIPLALRDVVMIPWGKQRSDATAVVIDRARTGGADENMYLRFRSPSQFALAGGVARAKVGSSSFTIHRVAPTTVEPDVRAPQVGDCWDMERGHCDRTRIPSGEYRIVLPGPRPEAIHVLDTAAADDLTVATVAEGVTHLRRGNQDAYVATKAGYTTQPSAGAIHVVLVDGVRPAKLAVTKAGDRCKIEVSSAGPPRVPGPLIFTVDERCRAADDARTGPAAPAFVTDSPRSATPTRKWRSSCCDAGGGASSLVLAALVLGVLRRRRRVRA